MSERTASVSYTHLNFHLNYTGMCTLLQVTLIVHESAWSGESFRPIGLTENKNPVGETDRSMSRHSGH